jgi:hypothetical protein
MGKGACWSQRMVVWARGLVARKEGCMGKGACCSQGRLHGEGGLLLAKEGCIGKGGEGAARPDTDFVLVGQNTVDSRQRLART